MSVPVMTVFNSIGGSGKTFLVSHLAWMYADLGLRVLVADLDPKANLTVALLDEDRLEELWLEDVHPQTVFGCVQPLMKELGDIAAPHQENISDRLALLAGDVRLADFEDRLSSAWWQRAGDDERAFRVHSAFRGMMQQAAAAEQADIILMDLGPGLGAINRAALNSADYLIVPLSIDLRSLQGLRSLGARLRQWQPEWQARIQQNSAPDLKLPLGRVKPVGYIVMFRELRLDRPAQDHPRWLDRIPEAYRSSLLDEMPDEVNEQSLSVFEDPHRLALLNPYQSLMPLAQEARKPMFQLKPADGAGGAQLQAARNVYRDFQQLARELARRTGIALPPT